jgi:hypothetical protein
VTAKYLPLRDNVGPANAAGFRKSSTVSGLSSCAAGLAGLWAATPKAVSKHSVAAAFLENM